MPALTVFTAASDVGNGDDAAVLQPQQQRAGEGRRHADVEPAIAGEIGRVVAVARPGPCGAPGTSRSGCRPWRHSSPAGPRIAAGSIVGLDPAPERGAAGVEVDPVDARRHGVGREAVEQLAAVPLGPSPKRLPRVGKRDILDWPAFEVGKPEPRGGPLEVAEGQPVAWSRQRSPAPRRLAVARSRARSRARDARDPPHTAGRSAHRGWSAGRAGRGQSPPRTTPAGRGQPEPARPRMRGPADRDRPGRTSGPR